MTALAATMPGYDVPLWPMAVATLVLIGIGCVVWNVCRYFSRDERRGFPVRPPKLLPDAADEVGP